jgi:hypothetical protein
MDSLPSPLVWKEMRSLSSPGAELLQNVSQAS